MTQLNKQNNSLNRTRKSPVISDIQIANPPTKLNQTTEHLIQELQRGLKLTNATAESSNNSLERAKDNITARPRSKLA